MIIYHNSYWGLLASGVLIGIMSVDGFLWRRFAQAANLILFEAVVGFGGFPVKQVGLTDQGFQGRFPEQFPTRQH